MSNNVSFENQPSLSELLNAKKSELPSAIDNELVNLYTVLKKLISQLDYSEGLVATICEENFALALTLGIETNVFVKYPKYKYFQPYLGIPEAQKLFKTQLELFFKRQGFKKVEDPFYDKIYYILR